MTRTIDDPVFVRVSPSGQSDQTRLRQLDAPLGRSAQTGWPEQLPSTRQVPSDPSALDRSALDRPAPDQFIWRDRLYVVRGVLGRWRERQAWWSQSAARAEASSVAELSAAADREVWRVQAANARREEGIFDLAADPVAVGVGVGVNDRVWRLLRVVD